MRRTWTCWALALCATSLFASGCGGGSGTGGDDGGGNNLVVPEAARTGAFGLRIPVGSATALPLIIGGPWDHLVDETPTNTPDVVSKFAMRMDGLTLSASERIDILRGLSGDNTVQFRLSVLGPDNRLVMTSRQDAAPDVMTPPSDPLPLGYNFIDVLWDTRGAGVLNVLVNEVPQPGFFGFTNTARVESVLFGIIESDLNPGTEGFVDFDDYEGHKGLEAFNLDRSPCDAPDNGAGTVTWPPDGCSFIGPPGETYEIVDGLPPGTTIQIEPNHRLLQCLAPDCATPGGSLGGTIVQTSNVLVCRATGTGALAGFNRLFKLFGVVEMHAAPRAPAPGVQTFSTELWDAIENIDPGDPDFDSLTIRIGQNQGLPPSGGSCSLTPQSGSSYLVESFFDIAYEIEFAGEPGSVLDGMMGTTMGTIRLEMDADPLIFEDGFESGDTSSWSSTVP